jgi:hypothetical protein
VSDSKIAEWSRPRGEDEIRGLLERAREGDATELASLREALDRHPETWRAYGDLAAHARDAWISLIAGVDLALKESLGRQVEVMKAELAGPDPSPLEVLLVERIVACWLQVGYADAAAAQAGEMSIQQANYIRKRQDSAHRRYLSAIATLAMTRRLLESAAGSSGGSGTKSRPSGPIRVVGAEAVGTGQEETAGYLQGSDARDGPLAKFGPPLGKPAVGGRSRKGREPGVPPGW